MIEANKWKIVEGLETPCADISFEWRSEQDAQLVITMHFSRVVDGFESDVRLTFSNPLHFAWEDESLGLIAMPEHLPYCSGAGFSDWVYPGLTVDGSEVAERYGTKVFEEDDPRRADVKHLALVSMNDLVHVVFFEAPLVEVLESLDP